MARLAAGGSGCARRAHVSSYALDFGDGGPAVTQAAPAFSHVYAAAGTYNATLVVGDSAGKTSTNLAKQVITVTAPATGGGGTGTSGERNIGNNGVGAFDARALFLLLLASLASRRSRSRLS